ncbi:ankyrin repeat-containing protein At5g02620-like [Vitis riparia]|uniref:ankyrin repeat-containing protein At5g02620-like n=1 Tax=Vitis riparia TaxID=96939 RepID=UPI00155AE802|nr:ankyrin repeat-containing protein At5g02620-like [Vitis riparia]
MDQLRASNLSAEFQNLDTDPHCNQVVAQDPSPAQTSNQAANGDGSRTVITGMDAKVYKAAAEGNIEVLQIFFLDLDLLVQLTPKHNTILHIAAQFDELECVNFILGLPSSSSLLHRPNLKGDIPLHLAAREGHLHVVKALLDAAKAPPTDIETGPGADKSMLRITNKEKDTALHEAVRYEKYHVVEFLIEKDPEYTYRANVSGGTPLYMAAERGFTGIVRIILDKTRTSPAYSGFMGRTALHAAVLCNDEEMTKAILEWNPALTKEVDEKGWSPLHCAAERNCNPTIVRQLLEKSDKSVAYLGIKDGNKTALHIASFHHHKNIIEELLFHYPDCCEQVDNDGHNVFHFSMMKKGDHHYKPSDYFLNKWLRVRGLVNEKDGQGNTPIHLLSSYQISDYRFVFNWNVDKKAYNSENLTAYDIISRAKEDISKKKILKHFENVTPEAKSLRWKMLCERHRERIRRESMTACNMILWGGQKDLMEQLMDEEESKKQKEKLISKLQQNGGTLLLVSTLITTVTFAAGFTLPGGYKDDNGKAILSKKASFITFVVADTIALLSSLSAIFLHLIMIVCQQEDYLAKNITWAFILTVIGIEAMAIAFASGLYVVLPPFSALSFLTCILWSCFLLSVISKIFPNWGAWIIFRLPWGFIITLQRTLTRITYWLREKISHLFV